MEDTRVKTGGIVFLKMPPNPVNDEINALMQKFRDGDTKAGEALYKRFEPLVKKYKSVLWYGKAPAFDRDVGRFLSFFNRDKKKAAELLSKSMRKGEESDLDQILYYSFYKTLHKYNKLSAGFKFILKEEIAKITKDVSTHRTTFTVDLNTESPLERTVWSQTQFRVASLSEKEDVMDDFVNEGSSMPGFDNLNLIQRQIAKKAFIDGFENAQIAEQLDLTLRQVRRERQKIREILKVAYPHLVRPSRSRKVCANTVLEEIENETC